MLSPATSPSIQRPDPWAVYATSPSAPWDLVRVVHLHRRVGFGATWGEIQRDLREGPEASITRLLQGKCHAQGVLQDFESISAAIGDSATSTAAPDRLKAWWVFRLLFSPDPLGERLTLLWHNHFATSNLKVNDLSAMRRQNEVFRQFARAPFGELLRHVVKDPATLDWLDAPANRKEHPNENLARESMELFTLGVGHYSETDVKEAARALTGWSIKSDGFHDFPQYHDDGEKTILGRKGHWRGDDFVAMLLEQPATSIRLAKRLCEMFLGETGVTSARVQSLADGLREHKLDVGWGVERILRSEAFFATSNLRTKILSPPELVIGATRAIEQFDPPPSTLLLAEWITRMGQDLFYPPNVFGWSGGRNWLNSRALVARINFAAALADGTVRYPAAPARVLDLIERAVGNVDAGAAIRFLSHLLLGIEPPRLLEETIHSIVGPASALTAATARRTAVLFLSSAEAQIG
ncbi:MAG TPA: DUF1800 domain-containing protein [Planctomycetaceae bacterium]|jgi:uncharacterized protein (DUF1800 family)|nr:DUF1800 domain-containing protein [Planctomycetaceae bacterium]